MEYEERLLNKENELSREFCITKNERISEMISEMDILYALLWMKTQKAAALVCVRADLIKVCWQESVTRLWKVAKRLLKGCGILPSWKKVN